MALAVSDTVLGISLFAGMTEQDKNTLIKMGRIREIPRGHLLFSHGDPVIHFYLIIRGTIQLFRATSDGHEKTISIAKAGEAICEDEIMDGCKLHRANSKAVEDTSVLEFSSQWLKATAKENSVFALNLLSLISNRAHLAEVEAEHQATMSAAQLVACFLQRLCILYDFSPKGFDLPYSKTLIASRLGMELETLSRTLAKLKEHGIIVKGNRVMITDLARISEYVCSVCSISGECTAHQKIEEVNIKKFSNA